MKFDFKIIHQAKNLRTGELEVNGKKIVTPAVIPSAKVCEILTVDELIKTKAAGIYCNPVQLAEKTSEKNFDHLINANRLLGQKGVVFTTSGAEEIAKFAKPRGYKDNGVNFRFPNQKQLIHYSPQFAAEVQKGLGSEIGEQLYRADNYYAPVDDLAAGVDTTNKWGEKIDDNYLLKPIVGGGLKALHQQSMQAEKHVAGYIMTQLAEIDSSDELRRNLREILSMLPSPALRVVKLGESLQQLIDSIYMGADIIYSDAALMAAQAGMAITAAGELMKGAEVSEGLLGQDLLPKDIRAFLIRNNEPLSTRLLLEHNLCQINNFVATQRKQLESN